MGAPARGRSTDALAHETALSAAGDDGKIRCVQRAGEGARRLFVCRINLRNGRAENDYFASVHQKKIARETLMPE